MSGYDRLQMTHLNCGEDVRNENSCQKREKVKDSDSDSSITPSAFLFAHQLKSEILDFKSIKDTTTDSKEVFFINISKMFISSYAISDQ